MPVRVGTDLDDVGDVFRHGRSLEWCSYGRTNPTGRSPAGPSSSHRRVGVEKLAHDLYVAFGDRYDAVVFDRIAGSETQAAPPAPPPSMYP